MRTRHAAKQDRQHENNKKSEMKQNTSNSHLIAIQSHISRLDNFKSATSCALLGIKMVAGSWSDEINTSRQLE